MKVIIAGSRTFTNYDLLKASLAGLSITEVVSGTARGADKLGERYAKENNIPIKPFPAEWDNLNIEPCIIKINMYGKKYNSLAGKNRNTDMAKYADSCVVFWDGKSPGTADMIEKAKDHKLNLKIIKY